MKKLIAILAVLAIVMSMAVTAYAVTPSIGVPNLPEVPEIKVDVKLSDDFWDSWFKDHPIKLPGGSEEPEVTKPVETEPEETKPVVTELEAPCVTEARYYHSGNVRLQIQWDDVENAEHYVVLIVKADGEVNTYVVDDNVLYMKDTGCPKVYIDETSTWSAATVRVMAVTCNVISEWSEFEKIGCDMLH